MAETDFLLPDSDDPDNAPFWAATARGELRVQRCGACGRRRIPPRPMCPACRSLENDWEELSGRGTIWSFVVPHPPLLPAYSEVAPYNVILVSLEEDPTLRLVGNLVVSADGSIGEIDPATVQIGEPVRAVFAPVGDVYLPRWVRS
ncbi:MAG: OB-fold domain-containing protein [Candidatus Binatia bacterium]|nr:OB-fold domain-containing protein [Candidatus Binatia bacterium]